MSNLFELKILRHHWVKDDGLEDNADLCSHGEVYLRIGDEVLSDSTQGSWTTSAAGLYLMRTLYSNYSPGDYPGQLIPCCGHFMCYNNDDTQVEIHGCPNGIDWHISHKNNVVELVTKNAIEIKIPYKDYQNQVLNFVNEVEIFYGDPKKKIVPEDEFKETHELFWTEWYILKDKVNSYI